MSRFRPDRSSSSERPLPEPSGASRPIPDRDQSQARDRHDRSTAFEDTASELSPGMSVEPGGSIDSNASSPVEPTPRPAAPPTFSTDRSQIDKHSSFDGKFHTAHDLLVNGVMEGEVGCEGQLVVAEGARIKAQVTAANITVAGELEGEITCTGLLDILPSGRLKGTVSTGRLSVQEGAICEGTLQMSPPADDTPVATDADGEPTAIFKTPARKVE